MAALDALSDQLPIAKVLIRMIEPDANYRCSAEQCLFEVGAVERRHNNVAPKKWWRYGRHGRDENQEDLLVLLVGFHQMKLM